MPTESKVLTVKETAREFGVTDHTIRRWLQQGELEGYKIKGKYNKMEWRIPKEAIEECEKSGIPEECHLCNNRLARHKCAAFKRITDPIKDEEGRCIAFY